MATTTYSFSTTANITQFANTSGAFPVDDIDLTTVGGVAGLAAGTNGFGGSLTSTAFNGANPAFYDIAGTNVGEPPPFSVIKTAIAGLENGNVVCAGQDLSGDLHIEIYTGTGGVILADLTITAGGGFSNVDVAGLTGGGFALTTEQDLGFGQRDIVVGIADDNGNFTTSFLVDNSVADDRKASVIGLDNGNFAVAWERLNGANTEIWTAVYDAFGNVVKAATVFDASGSINRNVTLCATATGFALAYEDNGWGSGNVDITVATCDFSGSLFAWQNLGSETLGLPDYSSPSNDAAPSLTRLSNGMLVLGQDNNTYSDTDTIVTLIDPNTLTNLASTVVTAGQSIFDDTESSSVAGYGLGQVAAFHTDVTTTSVVGELLQGERTTTGDVTAEVMNGDDLVDVMYGDGGNDVLNSYRNNDRLYGQAGEDVLIAGEGNDVLDGGSEADVMIGGDGNDTYYVENIYDACVETSSLGGDDRVVAYVSYTLGLNVEKLTLHVGAGAIDGTGNGLANTLIGNEFANVLDGSTGADAMTGGDGSDTYYVDNVGDIVTETNTSTALSESDTVISSITYTLGANVERLTLSGTAAIDGTGNSLNNALTGNFGVNVLNGLGGADTMTGGDGHDFYYVDNAGDVVIETNADVLGGTDRVHSSINYTLGTNVENLFLTGTAPVNGTGNTLSNNIRGNNRVNTLSGDAGNDFLEGLGGNDVLIGGTGNDYFKFATALASNVDTITDFTNAAGNNDIIGLDDAIFTALSVGALTSAQFLSQAGATAATNINQRIVYNSTTGDLYYDADGSLLGGVAAVKFATLSNHAAITYHDFTVF